MSAPTFPRLQRNARGNPAMYLGDGAYVELSHGQVALYTSDGISDSNTVVLGRGELELLALFLKEIGLGDILIPPRDTP